MLKTAGSSLGYKHTEESIAKISASKKGTKHPMFKKHHSYETLQKMSKANKRILLGKNLSIETIEKISKALKGEKNPMFGKQHSDETRKKIAEKKKVIQDL